MALAGKDAAVKASTDGGTTTSQVKELNSADMTQSGENIDITAMGDGFINRIQGLKDGSYSLSGFYDPDDTNGQVAIRSAWLNDTAMTIQYLPDGTNGFQQDVKVSSFDPSTAVDGAVEVSIELEGDGPITAVP